MEEPGAGPGWWQASDGNWYPPQPAQAAGPPPPPDAPVQQWTPPSGDGHAGGASERSKRPRRRGMLVVALALAVLAAAGIGAAVAVAGGDDSPEVVASKSGSDWSDGGGGGCGEGQVMGARGECRDDYRDRTTTTDYWSSRDEPWTPEESPSAAASEIDNLIDGAICAGVRVIIDLRSEQAMGILMSMGDPKDSELSSMLADLKAERGEAQQWSILYEMQNRCADLGH